ncbi:MAG: hypothetical protein JXR51_07945 [Bacteroidales bacterium]|nr:hypothetical protein [Bacteroidales bacterium]
MEKEDIYQKLMELFGKMPENFSILDEQIDIKIQMNYFEASKENKKHKINKEYILKNKDKIFENELSFEEKKKILVQLASLDNVEAFRTIEKYVNQSDDEIRQWAMLAMQECRIALESSLLNENQVIISTGLGGKDKKLRYFTAISSASNIDFSALQKKLIRKEFEFVLKNQGGEIEELKFDGAYASLLVLVPISVSVKIVIDSVISECNQIGNFINVKFVLTNVRKYSIEEIKESWNKISEK